MKTLEDARALAEEMVEIGKSCGRNVAAVLSNMDIPLGRCVGNALEVMEAVEILRGEGCPDLREVCLTLSANMLSLVHGWSIEESLSRATEALDSGLAFATMKQWVAAQGGDASVLEDFSKFKQPRFTREVTAEESGWMTAMDAQKVGEASALLGAGRARKEDAIDPSAGIRLRKKTGEHAEQGEPIAVLYTDRAESLDAAEQMLRSACRWGGERPERQPLIYGVVR